MKGIKKMNIKMNKDGERIFNVTRLEAERAIAEVISTDNNLEMTDNQWWIGSLDKLKEQIIEDEFGYDDKDHTKHDAFLKKIETENDLKKLEEQANQSATAMQKIAADGEKL